jgi:hypothetical protein
MERFNLNTLNEVEVKEKYRVEISNRFPASEDMDIKISAKESLGYYELK